MSLEEIQKKDEAEGRERIPAAALDKDSLDNGEADNIFAEDAKALRAAAELLKRCEEVNHGRWEKHRYYLPIETGCVVCSECRRLSAERYDYCPHCGAKMDGGEKTK